MAGEAHFVIYVDTASRYRWRLRAPNGEIIADSGQGYATNRACREAIERVRFYVQIAVIVDTTH